MGNESDQSRPAVLELIDVTIPSRSAPNTVALDQVNWTVRAGDFWVIGGLHGSGKSDLLATAAGLAKPSRGTHKLFGKEIVPSYDDEYLAERLRVGLVFGQGGRLFNQLTVAENVALPGRYHRPPSLPDVDARVTALLQGTEMESWSQRMPFELRMNWRQRIGLARALVLKPEVLLLDNPLAGLDPRDTRWWISLILDLAHGHELMDGRPVTIVAAADDLRPWRLPQCRYALLQDARLTVLEGAPEPDAGDVPVLRDLFAAQPRTT